MTKISELSKAEVNEAVAVEVMEWISKDELTPMLEPFYWMLKGGGVAHNKDAWNPTESIAQAMAVFNKSDSTIQIHKLKWSTGDISYYVSTLPMEQIIRINTFSFQDLPDAICRAALEAVRHGR